MSKLKEKKQDLTLDDFKFLSAGKLRKMEIRFNSNTSNKLMAKASFIIENEREDTEVAIYTKGKDFEEVMRKVHDWHENYYKNIKVFGKLTGREKDEEASKSSMPF
jgi:hypothetical protein